MGKIFHILNRGIEKRSIFRNDTDRLRFVHNLNDFNHDKITTESYKRRKSNFSQLSEVAPPTAGEPLVDILCWCLMPNHAHLLVVTRADDGASMFSRKVFGGYTMYFNEQNERSGVLFQGRSKIINVVRDAHFLYLPFYIHLNPLSVFQSDWKVRGIKDKRGALRFLEEYRWSNYRDILSESAGEFSHITARKQFCDFFKTNPGRYRREFESFISDDQYFDYVNEAMPMKK